MKTVSVSEARNRLCELIDGLQSGPVTITNRGKVVAQLSPPPELDEDARVAELERRGILEPPRIHLSREQRRAILTAPGVKLPDDAPSVVEFLLEERREGR